MIFNLMVFVLRSWRGLLIFTYIFKIIIFNIIVYINCVYINISVESITFYEYKITLFISPDKNWHEVYIVRC